MQHLSKLALTVNSQKQPVSPVARKRLNLLRKLETQIEAAQAELKDEEFFDGIGPESSMLESVPIFCLWKALIVCHNGLWPKVVKALSQALTTNIRQNLSIRRVTAVRAIC